MIDEDLKRKKEKKQRTIIERVLSELLEKCVAAAIEVTMDVYTHLETGDIQDEFNRVVGTSDRYNFYPLDRTPAIVSLADDSPDDEGEPDMDWEPDEDD